MAAPRKTAKRWTKEELDDFANTPNLLPATQLAIQLGPLVLALWTAKNE